MTMQTYMPYGAYELKARYQLNLMLAMLITISTVGILLLTAYVASLFGADDILVPPPKPEIVKPWDIPPPPLVIPQTPDISTEAAAPVKPRYFIPNPVVDEEVIDDNVILATIEERKDIVSNPLGELTGDGRGIIVDTHDIGGYIPPIYEFVAMEIYPEMIYRHVPEYPRLAELAGITGVVHVRVLVDENGNVIDARVQKTSHTTSLDEAAVEAAYKNKFKPGIQNGIAVKCWVSYRVAFELDD
ncbi:MAG: energy transducer TonB [Candidatus Zixiibacteriota bacterium]|nr:MAG: energy transducer TonB [candidate division Zixibacteria bacterium]